MDDPYYFYNDQRYDRITRILDYFALPELVDWKLNVGRKESNRISREALKIGSNVDEAIRAEVNKLKPVKLKTTESKSCWEAWEQWKKDYAVDIAKLRTVNTVYDHSLMVAGTPDLEWNNNTVIDIKCSSEIRPNYWLQTEFYGRCLGYEFGLIENKAILRLNKNLGTYEFRKMSLSDYHWEAVKSAIKLFRYHSTVTDGAKEGSNEYTNINAANTAQRD